MTLGAHLRVGHAQPAVVFVQFRASAAQVGDVDQLPSVGAGEAGFWLGLWHGLISPVTFVVSLFTDAVSIYEVRNSGGWYDLGFVAGVSVAFGSGGHGAGSARRSARRTRSSR